VKSKLTTVCVGVLRQPSWQLVKGRVMHSTGYLEVVTLIERLHRQFLEVVKLELEASGFHDVNNVQALMLFNIGDAEMTLAN
jgi:hypothetical protein